MEQYMTIPGAKAHSTFKKDNIVQHLGLRHFSSQFIHLILLQEGQVASEADRTALSQLLRYGTPSKVDHLGSDVKGAEQDDRAGASTYTFYVTPRTISPWSSKATNIAQVCGYGHLVKRIERGVVIKIAANGLRQDIDRQALEESLHDRMTETFSTTPPNLSQLFAPTVPLPAQQIDLGDTAETAKLALQASNRDLGLALDSSEIDYLIKAYDKNGPVARNPFDVELFMFAQVNSEHCRHKQFNASWTIDGHNKEHSLFGMIRSTHAANPGHVISAYSDNAAVVDGIGNGAFLAPASGTAEYTSFVEPILHTIKVETHNHPTAISPFPGAATGSGGEIRDEGAVGRGSTPQAGLCGYNVSDLNIPSHHLPWERQVGKPGHVASSLQIMLEAPIGSSGFNNEFGRPVLAGYFRTLLAQLPLEHGAQELRGYHKPIMIAGGMGRVRPQNALKDPDIVPSGSHVIVLGGPAMLIGLGGGSASSVTSAESSAELDFASVQRGNAEVQRRAQEVINACAAMGSASPILFIHDVGAGGLSNALPELCHDAGLGAEFELRNIDNAGCSSAMEIWCNEAQERYVLAVGPKSLDTFTKIAQRERCSFSNVGRTNTSPPSGNQLVLADRECPDASTPIDLPMSTLFGKPPKLHREVQSRRVQLPPFDASLASYLPKLKDIVLHEAINRVLQLPSVGSKMFLITIGDRTVGGLTARDQLVGPWQVPVADVAVTVSCLKLGVRTGAAMAMGEKPSLALLSPAASARMAIAESLMNLAAADVADGLGRVRLSANWMSPINHPGEGANIYQAVLAATEMCKTLKISIPVGKDSTSMKMSWSEKSTHEKKEVTAPLSLVISAFTGSRDIQNHWTPQLRRPEESDVGESVLLLVDLAAGYKTLGGSALAQVFGQVGSECPDVRDEALLSDYYDAIDQLHEAGIVLAYHDSSDGGILAAVCEMMFAGATGVSLLLDSLCTRDTSDIISSLFTEELAAVFQVRKKDVTNFKRCFATCGPPAGLIKNIGSVLSSTNQDLTIYHGTDLLYRKSRRDLQQCWSQTSFQMQRIRDNPECAQAEYDAIGSMADPGLSYRLTFDPAEDILSFTTKLTSCLPMTQKPRVAILREQGVNGAPEMAFAFMSAGFTAVDVHMTDLIAQRVSLSSFVGLAACGGFSYGDVLGAGRGWSSSVSLNPQMRQEFRSFFSRPDTFAIGVCNGCQFLTQLAQEGDIMPGTDGWPTFERNISEQFEARFSMVEILDNVKAPCVFLHGMAGSRLPIAVSHAEGRASFSTPSSSLETNSAALTADDQHIRAQALFDHQRVAFRYVDNQLKPTEQYPANPNGSPLGIAGLVSENGRILVSMPHFERTILNGTGSWYPAEKAKQWGDMGPWARMFKSARRWVG